MSKALFLDRDGVLILDKHYLSDPKDVEVVPGVAEALREAKALGYKLFLFTNQSGISRGYYTWEQVHACNSRMLELMALEESIFTELCIAPEAPGDQIVYRKPSPKFILEMMEAHGLERSDCWMVGDKISDIEAGLLGGINAAWVSTGKPECDRIKAKSEQETIKCFADLREFVSWLASVSAARGEVV
ncbi:MAG: hypothetical protein COZ46_07975 [Verrucomicrobia bacterium CG_4_10_14_3_um_filter_43_23]|nr:MAG: hypothetical protein AUJ82_03415 [Verrucomicrobia bacterium CG1_02_43_26]PIP58964.1 MAG: hypothetical protein COX01_06290 [Verrucomicrobia bacterium CG22_combo_CG10-13_8_21_14_all_43_17]PIX57691.1 MAG: hypothetical protein COZ46_07975 [Verrucomicrobia bacterium CG_4_10_14_3_um_filter_43_23]PIY61826.1 MAG: hypothetical protein COY94_03880 [Verrucomicrobia bacterium CG_4_10_14_0_8_um_filter_43_34]PJA44775.1 MAG: hypothetical protein CO175_01440 [Verrucomicrobia bacterium CG_4_9_14_3_um_fi